MVHEFIFCFFQAVTQQFLNTPLYLRRYKQCLKVLNLAALSKETFIGGLIIALLCYSSQEREKQKEEKMAERRMHRERKEVRWNSVACLGLYVPSIDPFVNNILLTLLLIYLIYSQNSTDLYKCI